MNYERLYKFRFQGVDSKKKLQVWRPIARRIHQLMGSPQKILDVAGGQLEFISQIPASERWVVDMVKYDTPADASNIKFVISDIFQAPLPPNHFDGLFVSNFLEHLASPTEVARLLECLLRTVKPGGRIAIFGPNFRYSSKYYFDYADHILPLTHVSVSEHLFAAGFELQKVLPKFTPFSFRGLLPPSPFLAALYMRMPFMWPILGKHFLVIATKPATQ